MSKAEELLNSLVEAYVAESDPSSDSHIVIGVDRFITVPDELKRIAVQYDHNMRTVTFDCPRYYDGRDMSKMTVYINIRGPKGAPHSYIADNLRVDTSNPSMMHFDWTIRRPVTDVKGNLIFLVCIRKADAEGNEENHWNSELNTELYISEGMEYEELDEYLYPDIVTQLLQRMDDVEALANSEAMQGYANAWLDENSGTVLGDIQSKGNEVINSIPEEYTETHNYANEGARTKADAIIRTVDGEVISVSDSSDDYLRGLRVFGKTTQIQTTGKNLCGSAEMVIVQNVPDVATVTQNGNVFTLHTTNYGDGFHFGRGSLKAGEVYTVSGNVTGHTNIRVYDSADLVSHKHEVTANASGNFAFTFTPSSDNESVRFWVGQDTICTVTNFQIEKGNMQTAYESYSGGVASPSPDWPQDLVSIENPTVNIYGKNILDEAQLTYHPDYKDMYSSVLAARDYHVENDKTYTLSFDTENTGVLTYVNPSSGFEYEQFVMDGTRHSFTVTMKKDVTSSGASTPIVSLAETSAVECGLISNVQIEMRDSATEYEPYKEPETVSIVRTLPGIPVSSGGNYIDANGKRWICDEVDFERGVYVQRIAQYTFDGSSEEMWGGVFYHGETNAPYVRIYVPRGSIQYTTPLLCNYAKQGTWGRDDVCFINNYAEFMIGGTNLRNVLTNLDTFKSCIAAKPIDLAYVLETPIETALSAEELNAFRAIRSNYHNTTVLNDSGVKMELKYNADTQLYIDNKIAEAIAALTGNT